MLPESLPPDLDSLAEWQKLPQNEPSKRALPPLTGGMIWSKALVILLVVMILVVLLLQLRAG